MSVAACLAELGPAPFYKFIIDPASFARTVENLFYVSFLVHEGKAKLYYANGGRGPAATEAEAFIAFVHEDQQQEADEDSDTSEPGGKSKISKQIVIAMTEQLWTEKIATYNLTKAMFYL